MGKARRTRRSREQERRRTRVQRMLIATGTAVVLVIALIVVQQLTKGDSNTVDPSNLTGLADVQAEFDGLPETNGTIGAASAKVMITEFGDLRCPVCRTFDNEVVPTIVTNLVRTGKARLQLRVWPILGPNSVTAAQASHAAQQQKSLWRFASMTYLNQGDETANWFTTAYAHAVATALGLDIAQFDKDRASSAANATIAKVNADATRLGFQGTPTIRVTGPGGAQVVDATYDAIAAGVQQVSGTAG